MPTCTDNCLHTKDHSSCSIVIKILLNQLRKRDRNKEYQLGSAEYEDKITLQLECVKKKWYIATRVQKDIKNKSITNKCDPKLSQ